ncbi:hypothetical protein [Bradyrhizobium sp. LVM 105]|uniref:hypothetical protein n=1 Tax=Bradyrhizobium sp. LVM 105 TaxID=2341115 RepID=UPI000F80D879|nr:hypothetical protein [Bradyrhizobium sp. LVM 105]RTE92449.1 hypothetical protein D6B98_13040 [Bradyrhizobium sp. LVM 105]
MSMAIAMAVLSALPALAQSSPETNLRRCAPLDFSSGNFRNVTEPGDVRILPTDQVVLINKVKPEATRVIFGRATSVLSLFVLIKDCSGTAQKYVLTISGEIDVGETTIDGNYGIAAFRRVGDAWMIQ